jgi:hypothetical protein
MYAHLAGFHNYNVSSVSGSYSAINPYVKPYSQKSVHTHSVIYALYSNFHNIMN